MIIRKNLPFQNVAADGICSLELEKGMTYAGVLLELGGTALTSAMLTDIKCKINGKVFYQITGAYLLLINKYRGRAANVVYLMLDFSEPAAKTIGGMYGGAIGTQSKVDSFTIEITIAGATAPTLESYGILIEPRPLGLIHALVSHPTSFSAAGKFPIVLPHGSAAKHLIKRVYFFHANMTSLEVKKNGLVIYEDLSVAVTNFIQDYYSGDKDGSTATLYVYDPVMSNDFKWVLDTVNAQTLQFNITVSGADTVNVYAEYITRLPML